MKRLLASILILPMLVLPVQAESIRWVDFNVSYESMKYCLLYTSPSPRDA